MFSNRCPHPSVLSTSDHHGAGNEVINETGGSRNFANVILDRVKFEVKKIKEGGRRNIFKQKFEVREGEKLLKASHCSLSTEAGAVPGLLFISTEKVAFCSQRSITSDFPYEMLSAIENKKIEIPVRNIRWINQNEPQQKKIIILREDNSELVFIDFLRYEKAHQNLKKAIIWQTLPSYR